MLLGVLIVTLIFWEPPESGWAQKGGITVNCSKIAVTDLVFSNYDTVNAPAVDSTASATVTCQGSAAGTTSLPVTLSTGVSGSCAQRTMKSGANILNYGMFSDSGRTSSWCTSFTQSITFATKNVDTNATYTIYGRIASGQTTAVPGSYTDTITAATVSGGTDASTTFNVTDTVSTVCSLSTANLAFGTYTGATDDSTANITVNCSSGGAYSVALGAGLNSNGTTRRMVGPSGQFLNYTLYSNSARTTPWGNGTTFGAQVSGTGAGSNQTLVAYGRAPSGQSPTPGSYTDTVVVTLSY